MRSTPTAVHGGTSECPHRVPMVVFVEVPSANAGDEPAAEMLGPCRCEASVAVTERSMFDLLCQWYGAGGTTSSPADREVS